MEPDEDDDRDYDTVTRDKTEELLAKKQELKRVETALVTTRENLRMAYLHGGADKANEVSNMERELEEKCLSLAREVDELESDLAMLPVDRELAEAAALLEPKGND
jgi:hypothetical protein